MIIKKDLSQQLPKSLLNAFSQLKIGQHLRKAGIIKGFGYSCFELFQLVFLLVFQHKNWFRLLESEQRIDLPGKDTIYRFLNHSRYNWRTFLHSLSGTLINTLSSLTSAKRVRVWIIDDSVYSRSRSKTLELLARVHDHTTGKFVKGFQMLTLGWSDGFTFVPVDFTLLSSRNEANRLQNIREDIDKRTNGYKRRKEALQSKPTAVLTMLDQALQVGIQADYVLMDTWFTHSPLIQAISDRGLQVIGMVKQLKQRYLFGQQMLTLSELFALCRTQRMKKDILGSIVVRLSCGLRVKLVFIQNRNRRSEWLTLLSTDCSLDEEEIVRIYGMRWQIETFFKCTKSYLNLAKEFQGRSYDMLISHTTIVFARYILLATETRQNADSKTLGGLFYLLCDEVKDMDVKTALVQLWAFMRRLLDRSTKQDELLCQLRQWISALPNYIKGCLAISVCES